MLQKIISQKEQEVESAKKRFPLPRFKKEIVKSSRDFAGALSKGRMCLIAEIKRRSPSENALNENLDIAGIVGIYNRHADAISVLTDKNFFNGSLEDMKAVARLTHLPVLRKDFIIDEYQLFEARFYGADAVLLIASVLEERQLEKFIGISRSLGMEPLVEVHNEDDLRKALGSKASVIGINNRDLATLKVDTGTTLRLYSKLPPGKIIVSESGITSGDYVRKLEGKANAVLVGTLFMRSKDPEQEICALMGKKK